MSHWVQLGYRGGQHGGPSLHALLCIAFPASFSAWPSMPALLSVLLCMAFSACPSLPGLPSVLPCRAFSHTAFTCVALVWCGVCMCACMWCVHVCGVRALCAACVRAVLCVLCCVCVLCVPKVAIDSRMLKPAGGNCQSDMPK